MKNCEKFQGFALIFMRLVIAAIFIVAGVMKFGMWSMEPNEQMTAGMLNFMRFLAVTETLGGVAILVGFLTRWAAAGLSIIMVGAVAVVKFQMGAGFVTETGAGWNFPLVCLAGTLILLAYGPGCWSIDAMCCKNKKK